jgi:hypothetical protein
MTADGTARLEPEALGSFQDHLAQQYRVGAMSSDVQLLYMQEGGAERERERDA